MQPEPTTLPPAVPAATASETDQSSPLRRPRYWLRLFVFWTVLPFVLVPLLDMAWGHPVKFPRLPIYLMLQWWAWVLLTPMIAALGRRFPLRQPKALQHALLHLLASWLVAVGLTLCLAAMAAILPVEWSPALILSKAFRIFEGFGALFQILYWVVLAATSIRSTARSNIVQRSHAQPAT